MIETNANEDYDKDSLSIGLDQVHRQQPGQQEGSQRIMHVLQKAKSYPENFGHKGKEGLGYHVVTSAFAGEHRSMFR